MNTDIYLDPTSHDIVYSNGDIRLTKNILEDATQRIKVRLQIFKGEWVLDNREGVPYFQDILTKSSKEANDAIFRAKILEEPLVDTIVDFNSTQDRLTRTYSLDFSVQLVGGDILSDTLNLQI